ncbi:Uncharacterized protein dnm_083780 [Desulfonema magnum]|uniref:Uncharacterized protein n=1 Tax=Desulfonema magnum TaxID=45655 RepID=A0A975BUY4_9BACT|nr:Uncharacterized protein dnm_083780 [Desulfonema magnum]
MIVFLSKKTVFLTAVKIFKLPNHNLIWKNLRITIFLKSAEIRKEESYVRKSFID